MSKEPFLFQWCLVCFVSILVAIQIVSQDCIMRNDWL